MKITKKIRTLLFYSAFCLLPSALSLLPSASCAQGALTPPGAPAPTMKSLDQIEPRTPIATNTTPGDSSAQFIISQPGSYYLTSNLVGVIGKDGISIRSDHVTLDLNGFAMIGQSNGFSDSAINVPGAQKNLCVRNGAVRGWGSTAVLMYNAAASQLAHLRVSDNGGSGIFTGNDFAINDCLSTSNGLYAILTGAGSSLSDCIAGYSQTGISTGDKSSVTRCTCEGNSLGGITTAAKNSLTSCTCSDNGGNGINLGDDCSASGCVVINSAVTGLSTGKDCTVNDCRSSHNSNYGFQVQDGTTVTGCTASYNLALDGFLCGPGAAVQNCTSGYNGRFGFYGDHASRFNNCTARNNSSDGFNVNYSSTLSGCSADENTGNGVTAGGAFVVVQHCNVSNNSADGVNVSNYDQVLECLCSGNGGTTNAGVHVIGNYNRIESNHLTHNRNTGLKVDNLGQNNLIVRNSATDNTGSAYNIPAANRNAEVLSGGTGFVSTDPWANFSY